MAVSSSMGAQECEEAWFDVADPCGKEFELPDISTPIFSPNKLLFSQYQQLDTPAALENAFVLDMNNLYSSAGNQFSSSQIMEIVPPMIAKTTVPMVNRQEGTFCSSRNSWVGANSFVPIVNHQVHHVPMISSGFSWNGLDMKFSLRNRRLQVGNSLFLETPPTPAHGSVNIPTRSQINHEDTPISKTSLFSSNTLPNRESESYAEKGQHYLQKRSTKTVSFPSPDQSYSRGLIRKQQAFGSSSLQVGQTNSFHVARNNYKVQYVCRECDKEFPSYSAFGGHMSFHARTRKKGL